MTWFEKEMNYARESLKEVSRDAIEQAGERLGLVVREGVREAGSELRDVIEEAGREIDAKLDKISAEIHAQRQFTKDDVRELVDNAALQLSQVLDARIAVAKAEITSLVQDRVEYFKREVDDFFIRRQQDLARERRRMFFNVSIAVSASLLVGAVSWMYHRWIGGEIDLFGIFRILFASLMGGYAVYLAASLLRRWLRLAEHRKDVMFLAMRYWGVLRPESVFFTVLLICVLALVVGLLLFPELIVKLPGGESLLRWMRQAYPFFGRF